MKQLKYFSYLYLILAQVMVGVNIVATKFLIERVPLILLLTIRFSIASLILFALHFIFERPRSAFDLRQLKIKDWIFLSGLAFSAGILFNLLMALGLYFTDANNAGLITSALPAIIALLSLILLRETFTLKKLLVIVFATFGLVIISLQKTSHLASPHSLIGMVIIVLALLPEAMYYVLSKVYISNMPIFLLSALMNVINIIVLVPLLFLFTDLSTMHLSANSLLILLLIGLSTSLFFIFWYLGSSGINAIVASLSTAVMPIATIIIASISLGETISVQQLTGMSFVMGSIVCYAVLENGD